MTRNELIAHVRSRSIEEGDCWLWQGAMSNSMTPTMTRDCKTLRIRRELWKAHHGEIDANMRAGVTCGNRRCVNPDHLCMRDYATAAREGSLNSPNRPARVAKLARTMRARSGLTPEILADIRSSDEPGRVLAERYGRSVATISDIRAGRRWCGAGNPFAALFAGAGR